jgi:hypothetical protein
MRLPEKRKKRERTPGDGVTPLVFLFPGRSRDRSACFHCARGEGNDLQNSRQLSAVSVQPEIRLGKGGAFLNLPPGVGQPPSLPITGELRIEGTPEKQPQILPLRVRMTAAMTVRPTAFGRRRALVRGGFEIVAGWHPLARGWRVGRLAGLVGGMATNGR